MTMRKYIVTIHKDGHVSAIEYDEPSGFVYCAGESSVVWEAYNQALRDVKAILEYEKARCERNSRNGKHDQGWVASWAARSVECEVLETAIEELYYKS